MQPNQHESIQEQVDSAVENGSNTDGDSFRPDISKDEKVVVTWMSLPHKRQLFILVTARLAEPLVQTSLQSYIFYQLQSFDRSLPNSVIAGQVGIMQGVFTAAQFLTAMLWGRVADSDWGGRKGVIMTGLLGTLISSVGFGFSTSFGQAIIFRCLGGALNGNIGVMRTMVSEIIEERRYQARAFLLLPMCFNIGVIIGPVLGGLLADPANSYPSLFGHVGFFIKFPYALPNLLNAIYLFISATAVFFGLDETLPSLSHKESFGSRCGRKLAEFFRRCGGGAQTQNYVYTALPGDEQPEELPGHNGSLFTSPESPADSRPKRKPRYKGKLSFRRIFTPNVIWTFASHGLLAMHVGTFNSLWSVFLSTPVADPADPDFKRRLPFVFTGGLGMPPRDIGFALAILGIIGITLQLFLYPAVNDKLGVIKSWRMSLYCFPLAYVLVPFLSLIPSKTPAPAEKDGLLFWSALCVVLSIHVVGRTFALPSSVVLINNSSPHPSVLATIHGIGQSVSSGTRTVGPVLGGFIYGLSLQYGVVGVAWWTLSCLACCGCIISNWVKEGDGHEIMLEEERGDSDAE